jgi:UDP-N-acetylglucosamine 2-epimerase
MMSFFIDVIVNLRDTLPQLTKLLRTLFLKAGPILNLNGVNLTDTLKLILETSSRLSKEKIQSDLLLILGDIMLECNLNKLYR